MSDEEQRCSYPGCEHSWFVTCLHEARCVDHMIGPVCVHDNCNAEIALSFIRCMREMGTAAVRLCEQLEPVRLMPVSGFTRVYYHFYPAYREMYEEAGDPLGSDDDHMWQWHEERLSLPVH